MPIAFQIDIGSFLCLSLIDHAVKSTSRQPAHQSEMCSESIASPLTQEVSEAAPCSSFSLVSHWPSEFVRGGVRPMAVRYHGHCNTKPLLFVFHHILHFPYDISRFHVPLSAHQVSSSKKTLYVSSCSRSSALFFLIDLVTSSCACSCLFLPPPLLINNVICSFFFLFILNSSLLSLL